MDDPRHPDASPYLPYLAGAADDRQFKVMTEREQRFKAGWRNFESIYRDLVDEWAVYDNSGDTPILLVEENKP